MNYLLFSLANALRFLFGALSAVIGLFFLVSGMMIMLKEEIRTGLTVALLFGVFPLIIGSWFLSWAFREARQNDENKLEKIIIALAVMQGGKITPTEVALQSDYSIEEAEVELDSLYAKGLFDIQLSEEGVTVYHYREMLSTEGKNNAQDVA
jgi:hypothetical protein